MAQIPAASLPPLSTTVTGPATGPGILLAHGATGSIEGNYAELIPALAASGHRVVAPDYPGSGRTPRAADPLTLNGLADALVAEAVRGGLETFTLIGFSLGTAVDDATRGSGKTAGVAEGGARPFPWFPGPCDRPGPD
ncbi:alpha/beta fold hydrolase [Streptomyces kasugaensis]|uniref:Alpha/beta fold hydrolase n=1 Tax=Streptomyces kasugaensis TaxID=1946 RepID=A0A4V2JHX7_STRKA|nr:alpha/beta fold hydrolase [Streptomyces kasugaensis]TBO56311.1 alpha/beta fold hydrolase [Streptomyces kasugaensis]